MKHLKTNIFLFALVAVSPLTVNAQTADDADSIVAQKKIHVAFGEKDADHLLGGISYVDMEELQKNHAGIPHGGCVIRTGKTGLNGECKHVIEYSLKLDSNPQFTSSVLTAFARAMYRLHFEQGKCGAFTVLDIPFAMLSPKSPADLRKSML
ncbi:MAG: hypothetical protein IJP62_10745 [Treponema sp.]|nr:hypothetical protein [Treponema sp.]